MRLRVRRLHGFFAREDGFTLIEVLVVLTILSISLSYVIPKLVGREDAELKDSSRRLLYTIRRLSNEAVFRKERRVLNLDVGKGEYWEGDGTRRSRFANDVFVKRAMRGKEEVHGGTLSITCFPSGLRDEAAITLSSKGRTGYTVVIPALGDRFELREE